MYTGVNSDRDEGGWVCVSDLYTLSRNQEESEKYGLS